MKELKKEEWVREQGVCVLYEVADLSLSTVRMVGYLEAVARKVVVFGEAKAENVVKLVDVRGLHD